MVNKYVYQIHIETLEFKYYIGLSLETYIMYFRPWYYDLSINKEKNKLFAYLVAWVGVFAADFLPSIEAKCCSNASNKLLGAYKYINNINTIHLKI